MRLPLSVGAAVMGLCISLLATGEAMAASFSFTKIADTNDGFTGFFTSPSINNDGTVAFSANQGAGSTGVFTGNGGATTTIAVSNGANPGFVSVASDPSINNSGTVAFAANTSTNSAGIFTGTGTPGTLTTIVANNADTTLNPVINDSGTVVFSDFVVPPSPPNFIGPSILSSNGGQLTTVVPGTTGSQYRDIAINNSGTVALSQGDGISIPPGLFSVNSSGGPITTVLPNFDARAILPVSINNSGTVAFGAYRGAGITNISTVNSSGGPTTSIADGVGSFGSTSNPFTEVGNPSINDKGEVVFTASLRETPDGPPVRYGLFTGSDPVADKVIATGDSLLGSTVTAFGFSNGGFFGGFSNRGLNNSGEIAFYAELADGTKGIFRAEPVPEPSLALLNVLAIGTFGAGAMLKRQQKKLK